MEKHPELFTLTLPRANPVPVLLNLPHSGTFLPEPIRNALTVEHRAALDETDWFLDRLYEFAPSLGITTLRANFHRWAVDLNRSIDGKSLYTDGRVITGVVPSTDFNGSPLYIKMNPTVEEIEQRIQNFYLPYYSKLSQLMEEIRTTHGKVLLWDGHSIRRRVPGIQASPFPDFVVGTADGKAAPDRLVNSVMDSLRSSGSEVMLNQPFMGGNITRSFYDISKKQYCIQLEMSKDLYMDDEEREYHLERSSAIAKLLKATFNNLIKLL